MKKKNYLYIILSVFLISIIGAIQLTTFSNNLTSENLNFTGNQNITRNLTIYRYANITSAFMNLSNYNSTMIYSSCYQESADTSNQTGIDGNCYLSYTGSYYFPTVAGNTSTWMYINYTNPTDSFNASWKVSKLYGSSSSYNILDSCLKSNILSLYLLATPVSGNFNLKGYCLNSTGWQQLFSANSGALTSEGEDLPNSNNAKDGNWNTGTHWSNSRSAWQNNSFPGVAGIYEESINWSIYLHPINVSVSINNSQIWNFTGEFNQTNNKTNDFKDTLNLALNNGLCDCSGCSLVGTNCSINLTFHSDTAGILQYSDININWLEYNSPNLTINSPNGTYSTTEIPYNIYIEEDYATNSCLYWVTRGASIEVANTSFSCINSTGNLYVSSQNTNYTFHLFVNDTSGNYNYSNSSFSTSSNAIIILPPSGGSSGGSTTSGTIAWSMTTSTGSSSYSFSMVKDSSQTKRVLFENLGDTSRNIRLKCENINGDLCRYVTFDQETFTLPLIKEVRTSRDVIINLPKDIDNDEYSFNIIATDDSSKNGVITFNVNVGNFGYITMIFVKLGSSFKIGSVNIPYALIFFPLMLLIGFGSYFIFLKKFPAGAFFSIVASLILPSLIIIII